MSMPPWDPWKYPDGIWCFHNPCLADQERPPEGWAFGFHCNCVYYSLLYVCLPGIVLCNLTPSPKEQSALSNSEGYNISMLMTFTTLLILQHWSWVEDMNTSLLSERFRAEEALVHHTTSVLHVTNALMLPWSYCKRFRNRGGMGRRRV